MTADPDALERYAETTLSLRSAGHRIPATLTLPARGEARGCVVLVPGSLFLDADGNLPMMNVRPHAYADLGRQLAARGIAVLRYAKRGPGTGSEVVDAEIADAHRSFQSRVEVLDDALTTLRDQVGQGIPMVLAGHSEGAVVVTMAAAQGLDADGVVLLSGPSVGIFGIMREQLPAPPGNAPDRYRAFDQVVAAFRDGHVPPDLDSSDPTLASLAYVAGFGAAAVRYMAEIDAVDPVQTLSRVRQPVLIVQGGRDSSVPPHHAQALRATRDALGLPTESSFFPELTHFYKVGLDGMDPMEAFMLETESDPAVADEVTGWMTRVFL